MKYNPRLNCGKKHVVFLTKKLEITHAANNVYDMTLLVAGGDLLGIRDYGAKHFENAGLSKCDGNFTDEVRVKHDGSLVGWA